MRCGKSSCNLLIILKKSYLLKNFVHYIKKMLNFHSLYSDCVWYKKLRELAFVHYIANFTISRFVITKFGCICNVIPDQNLLTYTTYSITSSTCSWSWSTSGRALRWWITSSIVTITCTNFVWKSNHRKNIH